MEFSCKTIHNQKALTAMARAVRKTIRAKSARRTQIFAWVIIALSLLSIYISWGKPWHVAANLFVIVALLLINWKQDALNGYCAKRRALPGVECADMVFYPDCYEVQISGAVTRWQYEKILAIAETKGYILFVMGRNHAQALDKAGLTGGTVEEFRKFLASTTGKQIQPIGG